MRLLYSRHLEHFLAVHDAGSLRQAASRSGVTQPALTKSLRLLESALQVTLFERQVNGVRPTEAATIFRRHALQIVNSARYIEMEIGALRSGQYGQLSIGAGMAWAVTRMPGILAELHKRYPRLRITLHTGVTDQLVPRLLAGQLDVIIAALPRAPLPRGFHAEPLQTSRMLVFSRTGHPLARRRALRLTDLDGCEFAGFADDSDGQQQMEALFLGAGLAAPHVVLRSTSLATLLATAAVSDSLTVLSDLLAPQALASGLKRLRLGTALWSLDIGLACRAQIAEMAPLGTLLALCKTPAAS